MERMVLVVDDSPDDQMLVLRAVKKLGLNLRVVMADGGREALRFMENEGPTFPSPPTLILLDLRMPDMDGLETLRRIRKLERGSRVPIVVFTSSNERTDVVRSYESGASSFIRKPIDSHQFTDVLGKVLDYWTRLNESLDGHVSPVRPRFSY